jgi:hypothetical protein
MLSFELEEGRKEGRKEDRETEGCEDSVEGHAPSSPVQGHRTVRHRDGGGTILRKDQNCNYVSTVPFDSVGKLAWIPTVHLD